MDKENKLQQYVAYNIFTLALKTHGLRVKEWKRTFKQMRTKRKKKGELLGINILISDKIAFKLKMVKKKVII